MGVMCPCEDIIKMAVDNKVDIIGLSGLITPSLDEMVTVANEAEQAGLKCPILIGGATTSRMHTAVKVAPQYSGPVVYVLDASRSVPVCGSLLDAKQYKDFTEDIADTYAELREEFYAGLEDRNYLTLPKARATAPSIDWKSPEHLPVKPNLIGTRVFRDFPIEDVIRGIDWNPFFQVWQLRGRYPNRGYPKIFNDETVGEEAKKLHADALKLIDEVLAKKQLTATGIVGIWPANSVGDDIEVNAAD